MDGGQVVTASNFVVTVDAAMRALAEADTPHELVKISDKAEALRVYARRAKIGLTAQNTCAVIRLRAERKLGEMLAVMPRLHGRPKSLPVAKPLPRLSDLGVTAKLSHRAQRLAEISQWDFEFWLEEAQRRQREITTRDLLNVCEQRRRAEENRQRIVGGRVADLAEFARTRKMGTIMIDPPWHFAGAVLPYQAIDLEALQALPIPALAAERCHLHMWATGINQQFAARAVIERWGFRIVGDFIWVRRALGGRNYWRQSHETLLTAVRAGVDDRFDDHSLRSWVEAPRGRHSEKPELVRKLIERASPPPRLELFGRKLTPGWFAWGHEVAEPLSVQTG